MRPTLTGKTLLVLAADSEFAAETCLHLARAGAILLLQGPSHPALELLDSNLSQSELHRFTTTSGAELSTWIEAQRLGLHGVVEFQTPHTELAPASTDSTLDALLPLFAERGLGANRSVQRKFLLIAASRPARRVADASQGSRGTPPSSALELSEEVLAVLVRQRVQQLATVGVRVNALHARSVVSARLLAELTSADQPHSKALQRLVEQYSVAATPLLSRQLGPLVETLLATFTDYAQGQVYRVDGGPDVA